MSEPNKQNYAKWYEDQVNDFLRGCEARNNLNISNYYDTINQWYVFYKQKCPNDSLALERLLQVKQESESKIRQVFEGSAYREIRESWEQLHLKEITTIDNFKFYLQRLLQHVQEKVNECSTIIGDAGNSADHLTVVRAASFSFILENLSEKSQLSGSIDSFLARLREAENVAEKKTIETQKLSQIGTGLRREIDDINAKFEQTQKRSQQLTDEVSRLKFRNIELENLNDNLQKQASVVDREKGDLANENSVLKNQIAELNASNEDLSIQIKRIQKQLLSEKDNYFAMIKENQDMISSLKKFHREEIAQLKNSHAQEKIEYEFKFKELETQKEDQIKQIELIAKTYLDKKNSEIENNLAESLAENKRLKFEVNSLSEKLRDQSKRYDKLKSQTGQLMTKYQTMKMQNAIVTSQLHDWREKCNEKDLTVATLQAKINPLSHNIPVGLNELDSFRNSITINNSSVLQMSTEDFKASPMPQTRPPTNEFPTRCKTIGNHSSDLNKDNERSFHRMARENLQLREDLLTISQKFKNVEKQKEKKLSRLTDELSTMHFLIKNFKSRSNSKTVSNIYSSEMTDLHSNPPNGFGSDDLRINFKTTIQAQKSLKEKSSINISNYFASQFDKRLNRSKMHD